MPVHMLKCFINENIYVPHGFFTRKGGVSTGFFEGLNGAYHSGDDLKKVEDNRNLVVEYFKINYPSVYVEKPLLITADQEHTANPFWIENRDDIIPKGIDALVTKKRGILLGVLTADCCPIFLYDKNQKIIAAIHAGWKGASLGIIENTIQLMIQKGAIKESIIALIGPCLGVDYFEIRKDFINTLSLVTPFDLTPYIKKGDNFYSFDLVAYVQKRLALRGIVSVFSSFIDTYSNPDLFYSYRRKTHKKEDLFGRQLSVIGL